MPRGYGNFSYVVDSSFQPFSMQEMLTPFMAYKEAYEQNEAAYMDLTDKADKFKYLSETLPEGSQARQIYEGYANDLKAQAEDLASSGLTMGNRRALTGLKRRYQGEIGRLVEADTALKQEQALRRQMSAKDPSMLYATNNLTIDNYLNGTTPNTYGISGTELYTKAAAASQSASKRQFSINGDNKTLGGYYYDYVQKMGYNPQTIAQFRNDMSAIPELQKAAEDILNANGVTDNLTGREYEQARQQVINGIIDGAVYQEQHNPQRDLNVMTAVEKAADSRARENSSRAQQQLELSALQSGYKREGDKWVRDPEAMTATAYSITNSGNPVYLDVKKRPYALGPDGKTKYYDNDKDGNYTDRNPDVIKKDQTDKQLEALKSAKNMEGITKAGYVPIFATVHPSHGSSKGLSVEEAVRQKKYDNIEGWRSGPQGTDVPDLYIDWTGAPLVRGSKAWLPDIFQWSSGSASNPYNGDFAYEDSDLKGKQFKILSDQEYAKLSPAIIKSIEEELRRQGYSDGVTYQVMEVAGKGNKRSYMTMVKKEDQILQGE